MLTEPFEIHPRLKSSKFLTPASRKSNQKTAYVLLEANVGKSQVKSHSTCGSACLNCYLIHGGNVPAFIPPSEEALRLKASLETNFFYPIFTGAELLTLDDYFQKGVFNEKPYLLSSGYIIAHNPDYALAQIAKSGINSIYLSLHEAPMMENIFQGVDLATLRLAIENIQKFQKKHHLYLQIIINVTVTKKNINNLIEIGDFILGNSGISLNVNGLRYNRHKAYDQTFRELMLDPVDNKIVYNAVEELKIKYPKNSGKNISVAGDFGNYLRPKCFHCYAGSLELGPLTLIPQNQNYYSVFPCMELRFPEFQVGTYKLEGTTGTFNFKPNHLLDYYFQRQKLELLEPYDGCLAYSVTRNNRESEICRSCFLSSF